MAHQHAWRYQNGRSACGDCGALAPDLRCIPALRQPGGRFPTIGDMQSFYACPVCLSNFRARMVLGELRVVCDGPQAHDITELGRALRKEARDHIIVRQQADAADALYGLRKNGGSKMPILDLQQDAPARLKRAGIIRLGIKKKSERTGKEYPAETPHFVLKDAPGLADLYGLTPKRLNIYLPFDEVDRNLVAWHQLWVAGGLLCRGDGERIEYAVDPKTGEKVIGKGQAFSTGTFDGMKMTAGRPVRCPGMAHDLYPRCQKCRPNALLIVLIREVPRLAYYQIATSSIHNIVNLTGQMRWVKENIGRLQGVPFILERRPDAISTPGQNGQRVRRDKYLLHLEPDPEWVKAMLADMHQRALPGGGAVEPVAIPAEVTAISDLDDEPEWEPREFNGADDESEPEPESATVAFPKVGELTASMVEQARGVMVPTGAGQREIGALTDDELEKVIAWLETNGNMTKRENIARAVAVMLKYRDRVAVQAAGWQGAELPGGLTGSGAPFEDDKHAIAALALSWVVAFDSEPERMLAWAKHFRGAVDWGDSEHAAAAFADGKLAEAQE